jgi:thermitase
MTSWRTWLAGLVLTTIGWGGPLTGALRADTVTWRNQLMDAQVRNRPLPEVLRSLAAATGWRVYLEPNTNPSVTAQFERLGVAQALPRLLGDLNFALVPQPKGAARLYVFRTTSAGATELIEPTPATAPSPPPASTLANELIVTLKPGARESIEQLARRLGAKVVGRIDDLNAYRLQFDDDESAARARTELERDDDVASVDSNHLVQPPARLEPLPLSQAPPLTLRPKVLPNGEYTVVALIDTAVAVSQPNLKDFLLPAVSLAEGANVGSLTHGTAMAETILRALSVTPGSAEGTVVRILPIDIYGNNETTTTFDVARGIYPAAAAGATIINLSLGSDSNSSFLYRLIQEVSNQGVLVIAAAGNQPVATPVYPAAYPEVLAVTAGDRQGRIAAYANHGDFVDVIAPGTAVVQFENRAYLGTGTSYATAYVSGIAAGLVTGSGQTATEAAATLRDRLGTQNQPGTIPAP